MRGFIHGFETWVKTKERQPVDGELPVTDCKQKHKICFFPRIKQN